MAERKAGIAPSSAADARPTRSHEIHHTQLVECIKDWEILRIPSEGTKRGATNSITFDDGRVIIVRTAKETIKRMENRGPEPIPVKYDRDLGVLPQRLGLLRCRRLGARTI